MTTESHRRVQTKVYLRAVIALSLIAGWSLVTLTGLLLYVAPSGPRSGRLALLFLTKEQWGDLHFWIGLLAVAITLMHIAIDWRALRGCARYLVSLDRPKTPCE